MGFQKPNKMYRIKVEYHFAEGYPFRDGVLPETYDTIENAVQALTGEPVGQAPGNCTHDGDGKFSWPTGYQLCEGEHMRPEYYLVSAASGRVTKPIKEYCNGHR